MLHLKTETLRGTATTENVLAELPGKNANNVVMAGAHLDSVNAGPGINDNGSGSAALLEVAENLGKVKPQNTLRLAWWAAEESSLVGLDVLRQQPRRGGARQDRPLPELRHGRLAELRLLHLRRRRLRRGRRRLPARPGSAQIEKTFESFFTSRGLPFKGTDFTGRSDYGPFIAEGIPSGGLFTGAEGIKTAQEAAIWGGTAGQQYDPCYHQACDTYANNNDVALDNNSDAIALLRHQLRDEHRAHQRHEVEGQLQAARRPGRAASPPDPCGPSLSRPRGGRDREVRLGI